MLDKEDYNTFFIDKRSGSIKCKVCGLKYIAKELPPIWKIDECIEYIVGLPLKNIDNIVEHGKGLAMISRKLQIQKDKVNYPQQIEKYPPMRALLMALIEARSFVHFISWGINQMMIGALKVVAQRVPVRGIVSGTVGEQIQCEVSDFKHEAPDLEIKFCESNGFRGKDIPHQKLLVIDGLLAFKGSANLTQTAWRSAEDSMEIIEIVSNIDEIISLHNQFFSPIWGKMNKYYKEEIIVDDEI